MFQPLLQVGAAIMVSGSSVDIYDTSFTTSTGGITSMVFASSDSMLLLQQCRVSRDVPFLKGVENST
jgi:hypothetical protein